MYGGEQKTGDPWSDVYGSETFDQDIVRQTHWFKTDNEQSARTAGVYCERWRARLQGKLPADISTLLVQESRSHRWNEPKRKLPSVWSLPREGPTRIFPHEGILIGRRVATAAAIAAPPPPEQNAAAADGPVMSVDRDRSGTRVSILSWMDQLNNSISEQYTTQCSGTSPHSEPIKRFGARGSPF